MCGGRRWHFKPHILGHHVRDMLTLSPNSSTEFGAVLLVIVGMIINFRLGLLIIEFTAFVRVAFVVMLAAAQLLDFLADADCEVADQHVVPLVRA